MPSCELNFPSSTALIEHNQRCYKMEYRCNICSKRFKYEFGYNKHMDVEHGSRTGRVSIQGVKSLGGDRVVFPRLGTRDTDRWHLIKALFSTCQCPWCPTSEKRSDHPKWFNSLDTNSTNRAKRCRVIVWWCGFIPFEYGPGQKT